MRGTLCSIKNTKNVQNELQNPNPASVALLCFTSDSSIGEASSSTLRDFRSLRHPDVDWPGIDVFHLREGVGDGHPKASDATQPTGSERLPIP